MVFSENTRSLMAMVLALFQAPISYGGDSGLLELAVLRHGRLCYDTPITNDVIGYLDYLAQIKALPTWSVK